MSSSADTAQGTSLQQFLTSLVVNFVVFGIMITLFVLLRKRFPRIYEPKTFVATVPKRRRVEPLPAGPLSWLLPLATEADRLLLHTAGLDGYLFLRYMKFMLVISIGGCIVLWPVLLPVYATGPAGQTGLDIISISNISGSTGRFYGAVLMGWIFIGFVCYMIYREYQHYLEIRLDYLTSPIHAHLPQATTVLITQIPQKNISEEAMQRLFGGFPGGIKKIHMNRDLKELEKEVEKRDKLAYKLEAAQIKLIKLANKLHSKNNKGSRDDQAQLTQTDSEHGRGGAAQYVPRKKRPSHKLGFLGLLGKKVDTIDYCNQELTRLNQKISSMQADSSSFKMMNSCFIEFNNQAAAQMCYQSVASGTVYAMHPRYTEVAPHDIVWSNMGLTWKTRMIKSTLAGAFVAALIIFWAIPVAFVGVLSNITYLTEKVTFLRFILKCPSVLLGLITSYLPIILLAVLMALLPIILRFCAKTSGIPTKSGIEYAVSNTYFTFLVVQVFLVVTVISSATSAIPTILANPGSVTSTLAAKLPTSSNFYIAYIILQGLAIASGALAQIVPLIVYLVLGKFLDGTPRKKWARFNNLPSVGFGTVFPTFSFLAMITLTYSLIAPLILIFSAFTFGFFYLAYKHNFMYVYSLQASTMGLLYPRALQQTMVGLYFLEVCMIGLVSVGKSYGSIVLMVIALIATIFFHLKLNNAFSYLATVVPIESACHDKVNHSEEMDDLSSYHTVQKPTRKPVDPAPYPTQEYTEEHFKTGRRDTGTSDGSSRHDLPSYTHAALTAKCPALWIPTDPLGVSKQEAQRTRSEAQMVVQDSGSHVDEKGDLTWDGETAPYDFDSRARDVEL